MSRSIKRSTSAVGLCSASWSLACGLLDPCAAAGFAAHARLAGGVGFATTARTARLFPLVGTEQGAEAIKVVALTPSEWLVQLTGGRFMQAPCVTVMYLKSVVVGVVRVTTVKTLVCLANSRKHSGRCIAGIVDRTQEEWIRPVSARSGHEVSDVERQYGDGSEPRVLDIVRIPLIRRQPFGFQRENWLLHPEYHWEKIGRIGWDSLAVLEQHPETLWINGYSTFHGENDRIPVEQADTLADSLKLIRVDRMTLQVHAPSEAFGNPRRVVRARFWHAGSEYALLVTDPEYENEYLAKPNGFYELGESFMTVSLGEPWEAWVFKLVAAIVEAAKTGTGDSA